MTSGGDAPGMNAAIRAIVKSCLRKGIVPYGIVDGYHGMIHSKGRVLTYHDVENIIQYGGTILGTARSEEFKTKEGREKAHSFLVKHEVEGLIVIGGDGTYTGAQLLFEEYGIPVIGLPGTIDNDIFGTDFTIGFDTAINTVVDAVDKIRDTATSHHRVFFVEVMGRSSGFIALHTAIACGAESVLIPEEITDMNKLAQNIKEHNKGRRSTIVIVAEGDDAGDAYHIMGSIKPLLKDYDMRHVVLGHLQRGGSPTANDRILATRLGTYALDLLLDNKTNLVVGVNGNNLSTCTFKEAISYNHLPNLEFLKLIENLRTK